MLHVKGINSMTGNYSGILKSSFPRWFRVFLSFCEVFMILFSAFYIYRATSNGLTAVEIRNFVIFSSIVLGGFWIFAKFLFYSVSATKRGLETDNVFGQKKLFLWNEIVEVRRPRFGIPYDFSYVISENQDKLLLVRSMKNYKELIQLIKARAPNLQKCQT